MKEKKEKSVTVSGSVPFGVLGKDGNREKSDKNRETNCENITSHSLYSFITSVLYQETLN